MTDQEKVAMAMQSTTKMQTMTPDEIMKYQQQVMEMTATHQKISEQENEFETRFQDLKKQMEDEMKRDLDPISAEYRKLPDGEGTPDWAITKGKQLTAEFDKKYTAICVKYITGPDALFKKWLADYKTFLIQTNLPFQINWTQYQASQSGVPCMSNTGIEMTVVKAYLDRCKAIFELRKMNPGQVF